jgi:hypothetical protein
MRNELLSASYLPEVELFGRQQTAQIAPYKALLPRSSSCWPTKNFSKFIRVLKKTRATLRI